MAEKRFNVFDVDGIIFLEDHKEGSYHIGEIGNVDVNCLKEIAYRLNELAEENQMLRETLKNQYINEICETCKFGQYEVNWYGEGEFECLKGHDAVECDEKTECEDFELKITEQKSYGVEMSEKRFRIYQDINEVFYIEDIGHYSNPQVNKSYKIGHEEDVKYDDVCKVMDLLNILNDEKELYKFLWEEMSYYFEENTSLNDLDDNDLRRLKRLSKGLVD